MIKQNILLFIVPGPYFDVNLAYIEQIFNNDFMQLGAKRLIDNDYFSRESKKFRITFA